ncbi:hypothetical protein AQS8620_00565 [Aquimixticola soesokkakensis]|uniref:Uncharacterized protein n=1 Tax=Aquimixticola soesokkakensis TaxID=1519096 RepID=A0A1Y5RRP2_9RHOB|nr:DUF1467 family protein [Aquimixticola soesokkakensis]SLN20946.1 hypothetical protein AQS8620_00565 [Aquimixticola soesokkakensis]
MAITSALVLFAVSWFMCMLIALPIGLKTQGDVGEIVAGTHAGSPHEFNLKRKVLWVTAFATLVWAVLMYVILFTDISWRDFDWTQTLPPVGQDQ